MSDKTPSPKSSKNKYNNKNWVTKIKVLLLNFLLSHYWQIRFRKKLFF